MTLSERWSELVDIGTRNALVLKEGVIFNTRYEGSPKAGAVKVRKAGGVTVQDYDITNGVALTEESSNWITISDFKRRAINDKIDGYEAAAIPDGIVAKRIDDSIYSMAEKVDIDGATELVTNGTTLANTTPLTSNSGSPNGVYEVIVDAMTTLTKEGVPTTGRWLIVSPDTYALILKCNEFIKASTLGDTVVQTGAVGAIAGFNIYVSNNLGTGVEFVAGHPNYATFVDEWEIPVRVQSLDGSGQFIGAVAIQCRKVYAHKVTNPACILVKTANF